MLTFKATLTSELTMPKDANFDIAGNFAFDGIHLTDFISLRNENFKFTKTRIIFSSSQKKRFGNKLNADPINLSAPLVDDTYYTLLTTVIKDKTIYQIEIGDKNNKSKVTLHLNSINLIRLKLVHDLTVLPSWASAPIKKIIDKWVEIFAVFVASLISFKIGTSNTDELKSNMNLLNTKLDTIQQEIKVLHDSVQDLALHPKQTLEIQKNYSYKDTTKTK